MMTGKGIFASWWRFNRELPVNPPRRNIGMSLCFSRWLLKAFTTQKRCAGETAQARYGKSTAVHFSAGCYRPLGGDRPAPKRVDARDPAETSQRTLPARTA